MKVEEMLPSDKAKLLTAISEIVSVNKMMGNYKSITESCADKTLLILKSIK